MNVEAISVVGLGRLGLPLAGCFASRGFKVVGVDSDSRVVDSVNRGESPLEEPFLQALIDANRHRLTATRDFEAAIGDTQATFIVVPTPSDPGGTFSLSHVRDVVTSVGQVLAHKKDQHLVVLTSTVSPGSCEGDVVPLLERVSARQVGNDIGFCYNPEFIALGSVIKDVLYPDFVLVGESDRLAGDQLMSIYGRLCADQPPVRRMSLVNAELAKLALNSFLTVKISFANTLAEICEGLPGTDVDVVTESLGLDSRIGPKYLRGGLGYGGPCFPRDNRAFGAIASKAGVNATLSAAADLVNGRQSTRIVERIMSLAGEGRVTVAVLGLTYKPDTPVVDASQGLEIARLLSERQNADVIVYDPAWRDRRLTELPRAVRQVKSLGECVELGHILVLAIPWKEFGEIPDIIRRQGRRKIVLDCWRFLIRSQTDEMDYHVVGKAG